MIEKMELEMTSEMIDSSYSLSWWGDCGVMCDFLRVSNYLWVLEYSDTIFFLYFTLFSERLIFVFYICVSYTWRALNTYFKSHYQNFLPLYENIKAYFFHLNMFFRHSFTYNQRLFPKIKHKKEGHECKITRPIYSPF